jgi:hypothetical protein
MVKARMISPSGQLRNETHRVVRDVLSDVRAADVAST